MKRSRRLPGPIDLRLTAAMMISAFLWCGCRAEETRDPNGGFEPRQQSLTAVAQVNSGGGAVTPFAADQFFSGGTLYSTTATVSTTGVTGAAPAAVYQTERFGNFSYVIGGLTANASYTVRLHFAEIYWTSSGKRAFNVAINGATVLSNYDIFAVAGANKAVVRDFSAQANGSGQIVVQYSSVVDYAKSSGLEILSGAPSDAGVDSAPPNQPPTVASPAAANPNPVSGTTSNLSVLGADDGGEANLTYTWATTGTPPAPVGFSVNGTNAAKNTTATFSAAGTYTLRATIKDQPGLTTTSTVTVTVSSSSGTAVYQINSGGGAVSPFAADGMYSGGAAYSTTAAVSTSGVANAAPAAMYQSERWGNFTYSIGSLSPGADYTVRLHFAEIYWTSPGQRRFNVTINGSQVLTNYDIVAAVGVNKAVVFDFATIASASGQIFIQYTSVTDNAKSSGVEILSGSSSPPPPPQPPPPGGTVILFDDFSGSSIDTTKWTVIDRIGDTTYNHELHCTVPANVSVSSGFLNGLTKHEDHTCGDSLMAPTLMHYTSWQIQQRTAPFLYGTVEVRAKLPGGVGIWPTMFLLGYKWQASQPATANDPSSNWPHDGWCETDMAEFLDNHRTQMNCVVHYEVAGGRSEQALPFDATKRYMVYRLQWSLNSLIWSVDAEDGAGFRTLRTVTGAGSVPNVAMYLTINAAVGGVGGGTPDPSTFPQTFSVDWIRITQ